MHENDRNINTFYLCVCVWGGGGGRLGLGTFDRVSAILYEGYNFCVFLFAFMHIKAFLKRCLSKTKEFTSDRICSKKKIRSHLEQTPFFLEKMFLEWDKQILFFSSRALFQKGTKTILKKKYLHL